MMKTIMAIIDCDNELERDIILTDIRLSLKKNPSKNKSRIVVHDCYHDEGKACKNEVIVHDNSVTPNNL